MNHQPSIGKSANKIGRWITQTLKAEAPRSKSLIMTIFGDSIAPFTSGIWLSELIALLAPFEVNERLVRTSSFRLMSEGWLKVTRTGRRSRYALTDSGQQRIQHAYHRIYTPPPETWDNRWTLALLDRSSQPPSARAALRRELGWEGFGALAPGVFLHPCADVVAVREVIDRLDFNRSVVLMRATDLGTAHRGSDVDQLSALVARSWELDRVAADYRRFIKRFAPALQMLSASPGPLEPQTAFVLQTLLIHSFRRVVLHDPRLPLSLLPREWPGRAAYDLCRTLYRTTWHPTQMHLATVLSDAASGDLKLKAQSRARFGGLKRP